MNISIRCACVQYSAAVFFFNVFVISWNKWIFQFHSILIFSRYWHLIKLKCFRWSKPDNSVSPYLYVPLFQYKNDVYLPVEWSKFPRCTTLRNDVPLRFFSLHYRHVRCSCNSRSNRGMNNIIWITCSH